MLGPLPVAVVIGALALAAVVLVYLALDRVPDWLLLGLAGVVELGALVMLVAAIVQLATGDGPALSGAEIAVLLGYLVVAVLALPMGFAWSLADQGRGGLAALTIVCLTEAFLVVRALQVWQG